VSRERFLDLCSEFLRTIRSGKLVEARQFLSKHDTEFEESVESRTARTFFSSLLIEIQNGGDLVSVTNKLAAAITTYERSTIRN